MVRKVADACQHRHRQRCPATADHQGESGITATVDAKERMRAGNRESLTPVPETGTPW